MDELWKMMKEYSSLKFDYEMKTQSGKKVTSKYYTRNKSMMGCSVEPNSRSREQQVSMQGHNIGIISGHAYSILDAFEIPKPRSKKPRKCSRLLRIKNPWGKYEWNGKWCDNSEEVIKNKERIENVLNKKYEDTSETAIFEKFSIIYFFVRIFPLIILVLDFMMNGPRKILVDYPLITQDKKWQIFSQIPNIFCN